MSNSSLPNLDDIIARVRQEAARPEYQAGSASPIQPMAVHLQPQPVTSPAAPSGGSPAQQIRDFDDLLLIVDPVEFVDQAYLSLLGRPADAEGLRYYTEKLAQGFGQPFVLAALRASAEARVQGRPLPGFGLAPRAYDVWRVANRLHIGFFGRVLCRGYHAWRHLRLAISGRLATHFNTRLKALDAISLRTQATGEQLKQHTETLAALMQATDALTAAQHALQAEHDRQSREHDRQSREHSKRFSQLTTDLSVLRANLRLLRLDVRHGAAVERPARQSAQTLGSNPPVVADPALDERIARYYLAFEDANRGSEADIRASQQPYLAALDQLPDALLCLPVLDIGCGRGEWLTLLAEHGFNARGVDLNPIMATHCQSKGLQVELDDALAVLQRSPDASLAAITGFHIIEHLPFDALFSLVEQAVRVLAPGGLLIFETPNPENVLVGSHTFYHDYSHRNPITPTAIDFLLAYHGFGPRNLLRLHPYPPEARIPSSTPEAERINGHFCGPQDFAIIGTAPAPDEPEGQGDAA